VPIAKVAQRLPTEHFDEKHRKKQGHVSAQIACRVSVHDNSSDEENKGMHSDDHSHMWGCCSANGYCPQRLLVNLPENHIGQQCRPNFKPAGRSSILTCNCWPRNCPCWLLTLRLPALPPKLLQQLKMMILQRTFFAVAQSCHGNTPDTTPGGAVCDIPRRHRIMSVVVEQLHIPLNPPRRAPGYMIIMKMSPVFAVVDGDAQRNQQTLVHWTRNCGNFGT